MPLHVEVYLNNKYMNTVHIGRETGTDDPDSVNTYRVIKQPTIEVQKHEWDSGVRFQHRYGDGMDVCIMKGLQALVESEEKVTLTIPDALETGTLHYNRSQALGVEYVQNYDLGRLDMLIDLLADPLAITDDHTRNYLRLTAENICEGLKEAGVHFYAVSGDSKVEL